MGAIPPPSPIGFGSTYAQNALPGVLNSNGSLLQNDGPKNYIAAGKLEAGLGTAQLAYASSGAVTGQVSVAPTFGASGNTTNPWVLTLTSTNPLSGAQSLLLSAAGSQPNAFTGFALGPFAIDIEDRAKVLQFKCSYSVVSGTWALTGNPTFSNTTQSMAVAFWDATNSVYLNSSFNFVQGSGVGTHTSTMQTLSTTASVYVFFYSPLGAQSVQSMSFDSFYLGPQPYAQGPAMRDPVIYPMTVGAVTTAPTKPTTLNADIATWSQDGKWMTITYELVYTSATGGAAGSGNYLFPLPSPYQIDTAYLTAGSGVTCVGYGRVVDSSNNAALTVNIYDATRLYCGGKFSANNGSGTTVTDFALGSPNFNFADANTAYSLSFTARVPIVGWSSNTVMSADSDARTYSFTVNNATNAASSTQPLIFTTIVDDSAGGYNASTGQYKIPTSGRWTFNANYYFGSTAASGLISKNGVALVQGISSVSGSTANVTVTVPCIAGDLIDFRPNLAATPSNGSAPFNQFSGFKVSGIAIVQQTESVNATYGLTTAQAVAANAVVKYDTKVKDTHNAFSTSTGLYTIPTSGQYLFTLTAYANATCNWYMKRNGSTTADFCTSNISGTAQVAGGAISWPCSAGDTIGVYASVSITAGAVDATLGYLNLLSIVKVG